MRLPHAFTYVAHARASDAACGHTQRDCRDKVTVNNGQVADRVSRCLSCASSCASSLACTFVVRLPHAFTYVAHARASDAACGHTQRDCRDKVTVNNGQVADRVSRCLSCASSLACTHACPCGGVGRVCGHTQRLGRLRDALRTVRPGH